MLTAIRHKKNLILICFFVSYLILGVSIFSHYGISSDEVDSRNIGILQFKYMMEGDPLLKKHSVKYHGPFFNMFLFMIEDRLNLTDQPERNFLMRHFLTFIVFFFAAISFYKISQFHFNNWKLSMLGTSFLVLSPTFLKNSSMRSSHTSG